MSVGPITHVDIADMTATINATAFVITETATGDILYSMSLITMDLVSHRDGYYRLTDDNLGLSLKPDQIATLAIDIAALQAAIEASRAGGGGGGAGTSNTTEATQVQVRTAVEAINTKSVQEVLGTGPDTDAKRVALSTEDRALLGGGGVTATPGLTISTGAGNVAAGARYFTIANNGNADGTVDGTTLRSGIAVEWPMLPKGDTYAAIAYDASGTEFTINESR